MKLHRHPGGEAFGVACEHVALDCGFELVDDPTCADVSIAPLLTRRLSPAEYLAPRVGTLVFHPSALPYRRGPDAVRHSVAARERVAASTWFWCSEGWDSGDVCEMEAVVLHPDESAGRAYWTRFVPAAVRALRRALKGVRDGEPRRVPQDDALATYDGKTSRSLV